MNELVEGMEYLRTTREMNLEDDIAAKINIIARLNSIDDTIARLNSMDSTIAKLNSTGWEQYWDTETKRADQGKCCAAAVRFEEIEAENKRLRKVISQIATNLGNGSVVSEQASIEFIEDLPNEVKLVINELGRKQATFKA